uniref:Odorant binding protein 5 n=1 Tax=Ips typographus TaxID=55986 RepID=M3UZD2_IPSTY
MRQPGGNNKNTQQDYEMWTPSTGYQPSGSNNDFNVRTRYDGNTRFNRPSSEECRDQGNGNIPRSPFGSSNLPRRQRSSYFNREDDDNDNDCISQCVLGYMQLLDTDRSPSETLIIKWLQEHVTRNEMDRIKALRDTRKCFGKLVTTDIEDGCEYAKELSKCLELDLE